MEPSTDTSAVLPLIRAGERIRRRWWRVSPSHRPLCIVYGNCQADAIRVLLERSPAFRRRFRTQPIAAVHKVTADNVELVRQAVASASLIVSHPVRDGYHGFPVGSEEILACAAGDCRQVTVPALYYDALYPFSVYVRADVLAKPAAPLSIYHDLRFLHCAGMGWDVETARSWLRSFAPPGDGVRQLAAEAGNTLIDYEAALDVRVSARLTSPDVLPGAMFTVDHPTNLGLEAIVAGIHAQLGLSYSPSDPGEQLLGERRAPLEASVIDALGLTATPRPDWDIKGERVTQESLLATHLSWYDDHRELLPVWLEQHEARMRALGMVRGA